MSDMFDKIDEMENKITLQSEDDEPIDFFVLEETKLNGENFLLVTDSKEGDGECYLLKDISKPEDSEAVYEFVEEDGELDYLSRIFNELMGDMGIEIE